MKPIIFEEQNTILGKPVNMTDEECVNLPCFRDGTEVVSKWRLTEEEIEHVKKHGYIWVRIYGGVTQPPICIEAKEEIFVKKDNIIELIPSQII